MTTNPKPIVQRPSTGTSFPRHSSPKPMRVQPPSLQKIAGRNREPLRDTNTSLSIRANPSLMTQVLEPKAVAVSASKGIRRGEMANSVNYEIQNQSLQRIDPLPQKIQVAPLKARSTVQSVAKMESGRLSFVKENQPRHQAPLKARKNSGCEEQRSAVTQLPSSSTGKLIERARQKVVEKHASRIEGVADKTFDRSDLMKSVIEVTKTSFCKDPSVIRQYMSKHKPTITMLTSAFPAKVIEHRPQHQEVSFERGNI